MPILLSLVGLLVLGPPQALAATHPAFAVANVAEPTYFSSNDTFHCEQNLNVSPCDSYQILVTNIGEHSSEGPIQLVDMLPAGTRPVQIIGPAEFEVHPPWICSEAEVAAEQWVVTCEFAEPIPVDGYSPFIDLAITSPKESSGIAINQVAVSGGGAAPVSISTETPIDPAPPLFGVEGFEVLPLAGDGTPSTTAADHPWNFVTVFRVPTTLQRSHQSASSYQPLSNLKTVGVELPPGFIGNPQAVGTCSPNELSADVCPAASRVGTFALLAGGISSGEFGNTGGGTAEPPSAVYSMTPEHGYPAEFGFTYAHVSVILYASVIHGPGGYRVRVASTGIPSALETDYFAIRFFGDPGRVNGSGSEPAFLTNPADCSSPPLPTSVEVERWEAPGLSVAASARAYPSIGGCSALQFHPVLALQPMAERAGHERTPLASADSPAGLDVDLQVPQTAGFEELATPPLKKATVNLPEGLVVNPSAAAGLEGCGPTGPQGINLGSENIGAKGQDLGDPEATELGEGHAGPGGNDSPYDDGYYHLAPGHCPAASTMGTVEATTPLLPEPLHGNVYLGAPECAPCGNADARSGKLLRLYLEINDPKTGVIVKLPGTVSADPNTGQLTATFKENPQLPVEDLKVEFFKGNRASLTTPQNCGNYETTSQLTPWSAPESGPPATPSDSWPISSGSGGGACAPPANSPHFEAGTTSTQAGAYSPFVLKLSREDGTQRLKALNVTLPAGLTGKLAGVQECSGAAITAAEGTGGKAEQAAPSCPLASELGTVNVGAGSGPDPFYVQGHAYLAGPYKGAPLSMAIITPAVAGPFDLGTVVVRAALFVDPETAQITVKSDPIPQIRAGIPLDVRSIAVNISRNQFTLNPTSCDPKTLAASVIADASTAAVSNPFQVGGCNSLGFKPKLSLSLKGATKRSGVPALKAVLVYPQQGAYANTRSASVVLPRSEFIDNAHIGNTCTRVQFNEGAGNGAQCPARSVLGHAKAYTPLLEKPLEGTVYLRSNGGERELPDIVAALHGQIDINLVGFIDSVRKNKHSEVSRLRTRFANAPDAPVSRFVLQLAGAKHGLLENSENLCRKKQVATVKLTAQNGKTYDTEPTVANDCGKKHKKKAKGRGKGKGSKPVGSSHR